MAQAAAAFKKNDERRNMVAEGERRSGHEEKTGSVYDTWSCRCTEPKAERSASVYRMKKKIGIVLWAHPHYGGVFQYSLSIINAVADLDRNQYDITVFYRHQSWLNLAHVLQGSTISWVRYRANIPLMVLGMTCKIAERHKFFLSLYRLLHPIYYSIKSRQIDLMIYPAPIALSFEMGTPYIIAVHDLQHRIHPEFPEVSAYGEWNRREYLFKHGSRNATAVLAESEAGEKDLLTFYNVKKDRVHILPYVPPLYLRNKKAAEVIDKYRLPKKYLFYPAQFWMHKNHIRLIEAIALIKRQKGIEIPVVLVGSKKNAFKKTMKRVGELGLSKQTIYLGYVSEEDMVGLYKNAQALIMPTFFGPSNIPQLEAFLLGCPVVTSDVPGIHEQVGDAAILVDPASTEAIASGIVRIWTDEKLRQGLIQKGYERIRSWTPEQFSSSFQSMLAKLLYDLQMDRSLL
jgi:glycosyltransferase involved in cell wall biosynthesis